MLNAPLNKNKMPTSPYGHLNTFASFLIEERPKSILDIGVGNGKLGFIARDLLDVMLGERYKKEDWRTRIDGVEVFPDYVQEHQKAIYDTIYLGNALHVIERLGKYEMVLLGDVLEHFRKDQGWQMLFKCFDHSNKSVVLFVPLGENWEQPEIYGNSYEIHQSVWNCEELAPLCKRYKTFEYSGKSHGGFLFDRTHFIKLKSKQLKKTITSKKKQDEPNSKNFRDPSQDTLRDNYGLKRKDIEAVSLARFSKHVVNQEHRKYFFDVHFQEHYRLIAYLSTLFEDSVLFDIGTNLGYSALALSYNTNNTVVSYDVVECKELGYPEELSMIEYHLGDVRKDSRLLFSPLIMLDTEHDGRFEMEFYKYLVEEKYEGLLFLDDIHLNVPMRNFWNSITMPKVDISDLGHWSGSGLVDFSTTKLSDNHAVPRRNN